MQCRGAFHWAREKNSGGYFGGVTPVPIPNTEVKPSRADGTPRETAWESRSPPDIFQPAGGASKLHRLFLVPHFACTALCVRTDLVCYPRPFIHGPVFTTRYHV